MRQGVLSHGAAMSATRGSGSGLREMRQGDCIAVVRRSSANCGDSHGNGDGQEGGWAAAKDVEEAVDGGDSPWRDDGAPTEEIGGGDGMASSLECRPWLCWRWKSKWGNARGDATA